MPTRTLLIAACLISPAVAQFAPPPASGLERPWPTHTPEAGYLPGSEVAYVVLSNPAPAYGARFGHDVTLLDFNGDGIQDLAVGVPGEPGAGLPGRVDVFRGPLLIHAWSLAPTGSQIGDDFGYSLAAGDLDGDGDDELAVGSPGWDSGVATPDCGRLLVFDHRGGSGPVQVAELRRGLELSAARLGRDVEVADLIGDGALEVAGGAPFAIVQPSSFRAGAVSLFELPAGGPASGPWAETSWPNPQPTNNHNEFGNRLAAVDFNGDGATDLAVAAIFNTVHPATPCVPPCSDNAGQTFVVAHQATGAPPSLLAQLDNPYPGVEIQTSQCISERFGMHLVAADFDHDGFGDVFIGANRDDVGGVCEAGRGSLFPGALAAGPVTGPYPSASFTRPAPRVEDLSAYRVHLADLIGGPSLDMCIFSLSKLRKHAILIWDGDNPLTFAPGAPDAGPPDQTVQALPGHGGHFCGGLTSGNLDGAGRVELTMGDYDFGPAGVPALARSGRVVVTFWP